jgi:methylase of polypeptide subunit release factors
MAKAPPVAGVGPAALAHLGNELRAAGYEEAAVRERLRVDSTLIAHAEATTARRRLGDDRLSELLRLFLFREAVAAGAVHIAGVDFLEQDGDAVRSSVAVQPWRGALVAHDWLAGMPARDYVGGAASGTDALADLTVRRRVDSALDLCTGSGAQAVLAARHADRVVGVDLNTRALRLAEWTLALSGVENVELRAGDVRDACAGERFELVVANPPYVVSPDRRWLFRDAGAGISRAVVERVPGLLGDGGFATVLCQWPLRSGESWDEQPRAWVQGAGCDAWILRLPTEEDTLDYADLWNRPLENADPAEFERTVDRWVEHFGAEGIERIVSGAIVLRHRESLPWVRADEGAHWPSEPVGDAIERLFDGQTLVASLPEPEALLDLRLVPVDGFRLDETRAFGEEGFVLVAAQARSALPLRHRLSRAAVRTVSQLDGVVTLRALPEGGAALASIGELVALGLLRVL